jgi:hypothetical protein
MAPHGSGISFVRGVCRGAQYLARIGCPERPQVQSDMSDKPASFLRSLYNPQDFEPCIFRVVMSERESLIRMAVYRFDC